MNKILKGFFPTRYSRGTMLALAAAAAIAVAAHAQQNEHDGHDHSGHDHAAHADGAEAKPLCAEHSIAEDRCPFCNPALIKQLGQCTEHNMPEALCYLCDPRLVAAYQAENDWCAEHGKPESRCELCGHGGAGLAPAAEEARVPVASGSGERELMVEPLPLRAERMPLETCKKNEMRVRLLSEDAVRQSGLVVVPLEQRELSASLETNLQTAYHGERYARIAPRVAGTIAEMHAGLGARVAAGELLATVDSLELGNAKAAYLEAHALLALREKQLGTQRDLAKRGVATQREQLEAEQAVAETRIALLRAAQTLRNLGLDQRQINGIAETNDTSSRLPVVAPMDGIIVTREGVLGELAGPERVLYAIADTHQLWAELDIQERDASKVAPGQSLIARLDGLPGETFPGEIVWLAPEVDPHTRVLRARAILDNPDGRLRAYMFGRAVITIQPRASLLAVPRSAVQWEGCCNVVFVQESPTVFAPHKVQLGAEAGEYYVVQSGVKPGDPVVTQGSFLLKTEILKESIGAGCCEVDHLAKQ